MSETEPGALELAAVIVKVTILVRFKIDRLDNGQEVDTAIEDALRVLSLRGSATVIGRQLFGMPTNPFARLDAVVAEADAQVPDQVLDQPSSRRRRRKLP